MALSENKRAKTKRRQQSQRRDFGAVVLGWLTRESCRQFRYVARQRGKEAADRSSGWPGTVAVDTEPIPMRQSSSRKWSREVVFGKCRTRGTRRP